MMKNRLLINILVLASLAVLPTSARAFPQQSANVTDPDVKVSAGGVRAGARVDGHVFAFPVATKSVEAQRLVETALDQYENVLLDKSVESARKATEIDPHFALAYAVWSFAARRNQPEPEAARKAEMLVASATGEERLLVRFLTSVQQSEMLPAIIAMNDLLATFPNDRHALYLTSEWLYFEQDYDRSMRMMEQIIRLNPDFAPAYNMLGYAKVEAGEPDPTKAIAYLKKYAELEHGQPNPEDSLGEVSRYVGDDLGSLDHYRAALNLSPTFITSQTGLGDTYTLMGDFANARTEYDKAIAMSTNSRDRLHVEFQKALVKFWEGKGAEGRQALAEAEQKALLAHDPYAQFEIEEGQALLAGTPKEQIEKLRAMERTYGNPVEGMSEADRNPSLAAIWRDEVRIQAQLNHLDATQEIVRKLEKSATKSRDLIVENCYESARGYVFFAQKDYASASDELSADPHSPVAVQWQVAAREKTGDKKGAEAARLRLQYLRAPTAEWYLATHADRRTVN
jgi:tetratricopeptide (TPR) repeat protein